MGVIFIAAASSMQDCILYSKYDVMKRCSNSVLGDDLSYGLVRVRRNVVRTPVCIVTTG